MEMYLVMTVRLRKDNRPVPISLLAQKLDVSSASANEMCHKLEQSGLIEYQPYKGIRLTIEGEEVAQRILRRRHMWDIFLIKYLGMKPSEADAIACRLEHVSSDELVEALSAFLEHAVPAHYNEPALCVNPKVEYHVVHSLDRLVAGQRGRIIAINGNGMVSDFLAKQGLQPGTVIEVLASGINGAVLLSISGYTLALARKVAQQIEIDIVETDQQEHHCFRDQEVHEDNQALLGCLRCIWECQQDMERMKHLES